MIRDVALPYRLELFSRRIKNLEDYGKTSPEHLRQAQEDYFNLQNSYKVYAGQDKGFKNPSLNLVGKKKQKDDALKAVVAKTPKLQQYASAWDDIAKAEAYSIATF